MQFSLSPPCLRPFSYQTSSCPLAWKVKVFNTICLFLTLFHGCIPTGSLNSPPRQSAEVENRGS